MGVKLKILVFMFLVCWFNCSASEAKPNYPEKKDRKQSKGDTTYYINPQMGHDSNSGTEQNGAWKTFTPLNRLNLAAGDQVNVKPCDFEHTLMPMGQGSSDKPVVIRFAPGRYNFHTKQIYRSKFHISNTNSDPYTPKAIEVYLKNASHFTIEGQGAQLFFRGKKKWQITCATILK